MRFEILTLLKPEATESRIIRSGVKFAAEHVVSSGGDKIQSTLSSVEENCIFLYNHCNVFDVFKVILVIHLVIIFVRQESI